MASYYIYLWHTTWPALLALLAIWLLILIRSGLAIRNTWHHERDAWGFFVLIWKLLLWTGILIVYTFISINANQDWVSRPLYVQGTVGQKNIDNAAKPSQKFTIKLLTSDSDQQYYIDVAAYKSLQPGDNIKLMILPHRQEVVSCEVLDRNTESD